MAIKAGQILHDAQGFVVDRIQSGGVSNLNIPKEKIYELGNFSSVATVRDIPDLSFDLESFDVSTEIEAMTLGQTPAGIANGQRLDFANAMPLDIISPFKSSISSYSVVQGIVIPYLTMESARYSFGVGNNSSQSFTFKGDALYYTPGAPYYYETTLVNNTLTYTLPHTALLYQESGYNIYALSACVKNPSTGAYRRLFVSPSSADGYTSTATSVTLVTDWFDQGYTKLCVTYASATAATYAAAVHQNASVKPAAVKAKDVCVYVSDGAATPSMLRWTGVQNFDVTRQVNLEADEEFCNSKYVDQGYDTADVNGTIGVKSVDVDDLFDKVAQIADVPTNQVAGVYSSTPLEVEVQIKDPDTGSVLKSLVVPDARFTLPSVQGRVQTKLEVSFPFDSDGGTLYVYRGSAP